LTALRDRGEQPDEVAAQERKAVDQLIGHRERRPAFVTMRIGSNRDGRQD
jgi:hypothetical protein